MSLLVPVNHDWLKINHLYTVKNHFYWKLLFRCIFWYENRLNIELFSVFFFLWENAVSECVMDFAEIYDIFLQKNLQ